MPTNANLGSDINLCTFIQSYIRTAFCKQYLLQTSSWLCQTLRVILYSRCSGIVLAARTQETIYLYSIKVFKSFLVYYFTKLCISAYINSNATCIVTFVKRTQLTKLDNNLHAFLGEMTSAFMPTWYRCRKIYVDVINRGYLLYRSLKNLYELTGGSQICTQRLLNWHFLDPGIYFINIDGSTQGFSAHILYLVVQILETINGPWNTRNIGQPHVQFA